MLPHWLYERLPALYLLTATGIILLTRIPVLGLIGALLFVAGALIWMMRSCYRRTDLILFPAKQWFKPEWLYEAQPFIWLAVALLLSHLPGTLALLALLPGLWACHCLWARHHHRHHATGVASHLRRYTHRRRMQRVLR